MRTHALCVSHLRVWVCVATGRCCCLLGSLLLPPQFACRCCSTAPGRVGWAFAVLRAGGQGTAMLRAVPPRRCADLQCCCLLGWGSIACAAGGCFLRYDST